MVGVVGDVADLRKKEDMVERREAGRSGSALDARFIESLIVSLVYLLRLESTRLMS